MHVVHSTPLAHGPAAVRAVTRGLLAVSRSLEAFERGVLRHSVFLELFDAALQRVWSYRVQHLQSEPGRYYSCVERRFDTDAEETAWVADEAGISGYATSNDQVLRLQPRLPGGVEIAAIRCIEDEFLICCNRVDPFDLPPVVARVKRDGRLRWSTTLPLRRPIAARRYSRYPAGLEPFWVLDSYGAPLVLSADTAFVTAVSGSGVGHSFAVAPDDGRVRFWTRPQPIRAADVAGEDLLLACEGYSWRPTVRRYSPAGRVVGRWPTCGSFAVVGDDVRMIEWTNTVDSPVRLVRLHPDGTLAAGDALPGRWSGEPLVTADGRIYFFHGNALVAVEDVSVVDTLSFDAPDFSTARLAQGDGFLYCCFGTSSLTLTGTKVSWRAAKVALDSPAAHAAL